MLGVAQAASKTDKAAAYAPVIDDPKLPRVLLIGDSISIGYTVAVRELLKERANVHRIPANGGPTVNGLTHLEEWVGNGKWDVIHFNWGLHDIRVMDDGNHQVSLGDYEKNLRALVTTLEKTRARLIWCSTTPVPAGDVKARRSADVIPYNATAKKVMLENRVPIDDLYSYALPRLKEIQIPVNVHFTPEGSRVLAKQVAASIATGLGRVASTPLGASGESADVR